MLAACPVVAYVGWSGAMADLLYAITAWVAEFESKRRSERIKAGVERLRREGRSVGRLPGAKDKRKRSRTGYLLRYAKKQSVKV